MPLSVVNVSYPLAPVGPDAVGGAEQIVHALDLALTEAAQRSAVVAPAGSQISGELIALPRSAEPFDDEQRRRAWRAAEHALVSLERVPDVVHFHGFDFPAYLPKLGCPVVVTCHLPLSFYPAELLAEQEGRMAFVAVSYSQAATARGFAVSDVILNGVDIDFLTPRSEQRGYVLGLGRLCPEKGFHWAVAAAKQAKLPLLLGGRLFPYPAHRAYFDGELAPMLDAERRFVGALGRDDKARLLAEARCLVVPSQIEETCSLVALEALACGTPVVGLKRGALAEVVEHGETGLLVDRPEELADALLAIGAIDRGRCRRAAVERFAAKRMTCAYLELYERLATTSDRARSSGVTFGAATSGEEAVRFRSVDSLGELIRLAPKWRALWARSSGASVFSHPAWLLPWLRAFAPERLRVVVGERGERLEALLPLCVPEDSHGPWQLLGVGLRDYGEALAPAGALLEAALEHAYAETRAQGLVFDDVPFDSSLVDGVRRRGGSIVSQNVCPALELTPGDPFGAVPAELRKKLARYRRRAAREGLRIETADHRTLAEVLRSFFAFGERHFGPEASFFSDPRARAFQLEATARLQAAGSLRLYALRRGQECLGALYGFRCGNRLLSYQHTYADEVAAHSPGILLTAHAIEAAAAEGSTTFDFLRGREAYKYRWGARDRELVRLELAADAAPEAALAS